MKSLNDEKFFDTITYTMGGVETVNRYYDDFPNIKWAYLVHKSNKFYFHLTSFQLSENIRNPDIKHY